MSENKIILSILIPTVVGREESYRMLLGKLFNMPFMGKKEIEIGTFKLMAEILYFYHGEDIGQYDNPDLYKPNVEILSLCDNKQVAIGQKREELYKMAKGTHSIMVDDDDELSTNAIELILQAIKSNPEIPCVTFRERCNMNGEYKSSDHSIKYDKWRNNHNGFDYVRTPFYKDVIRTDIARSVPFEKIRWNEDERWSYAIQPFLVDEIHIEQELYYYNYEPKESPNERYGIIN